MVGIFSADKRGEPDCRTDADADYADDAGGDDGGRGTGTGGVGGGSYFSFSALQSPSAFPSFLSEEEEEEEEEETGEDSQFAPQCLYCTASDDDVDDDVVDDDVVVDDDDAHDHDRHGLISRHFLDTEETLKIPSYHDCEELPVDGISENEDKHVETVSLNQIDGSTAAENLKGDKDPCKETLIMSRRCRANQDKILNHGCAEYPNKYSFSYEEFVTPSHGCVEKPKEEEIQFPSPEKELGRHASNSSRHATINFVSKNLHQRALEQKGTWQGTWCSKIETVIPCKSPNKRYRSMEDEMIPLQLSSPSPSPCPLPLSLQSPCPLPSPSPSPARRAGGGSSLLKRKCGRDEEGWMRPREMKNRSSFFSRPVSSCSGQSLLDKWIANR